MAANTPQQVYIAVTPVTLGTTVYSPPLKDIYVGTTGTLEIRGFLDTNPVTLTSVPVGWQRLPYPVVEVISTGTTATNLVAAQTA